MRSLALSLPSPSRTLALATIALTALAACGKNNENNLSAQDEPAVNLEIPANGALNLELPLKEREPLELPPIRILSSGAAPLKITGIDWVGEKPSRVFMFKSRRDDVTPQECTSPIYYPQSRVCIEVGAPDFSAPLNTNALFELQLHVAAYEPGQSNVVECPDPPSDVPAQFLDRYCGAIRITTNARNSTGPVTSGATTVYLQANRSSGRVSLTTATLDFTNVIPGYSSTQSFGIINSGTTPLTVDRVLPRDFGQYITVTGAEQSKELAPNESMTVNVRLEIPTSVSPDQLSFSAQIGVESSAPDSPHNVTLTADNTREIPPVPQSDRASISFAGDGDVQDFVLTNPGDIPVSITGVAFEPSDAVQYYTLLNGQGGAFQAPTVIREPSTANPDRNKVPFKLQFTKPAGDEVGLASMILNYNYFVGELTRSGTLRVTLLGDKAQVAYGDIVPTVFSFSTRESGSQQRTAAIYNLGTAPLEVTALSLQPLAGGIEEFTVRLVGASFPAIIAPGAIQLMEISFVATNNNVDQIDARITSTSETLDPLSFTLTSLDVPLATDALTFVTSYVDTAPVGELLSLEFGPEVAPSVANNAEWVILKRPATSQLYLKTIGPKIGLVIDQPGAYELLVTASSGGVDVQEIVTINAVAAD